jgi:hypothetical protein
LSSPKINWPILAEKKILLKLSGIGKMEIVHPKLFIDIFKND